MRPEPDAARFLNVDLELDGEVPSPALLAQARRKLLILHEGEPFLFSAELSSQTRTVEEAVTGFVAFVDGLGPKARAEWDACTSRVLNAGFEQTGEGHASEFGVSARSVAALARIGAGFAVTIYARPQAERGAGADLPQSPETT